MLEDYLSNTTINGYIIRFRRMKKTSGHSNETFIIVSLFVHTHIIYFVSLVCSRGIWTLLDTIFKGSKYLQQHLFTILLFHWMFLKTVMFVLVFYYYFNYILQFLSVSWMI